MFCLLIKVKLDGTTSQIEDSMLSAILDKENTLQNMFIITISIPKPMSNLELQEVLRVLTQDNSSLKVNSVMKLNGETFLINQNDSNLFI
jgi:hypothetical protein